jgi:hypothetical protein
MLLKYDLFDALVIHAIKDRFFKIQYEKVHLKACVTSVKLLFFFFFVFFFFFFVFEFLVVINLNFLLK